ncbi:hypothetical protein C0995_014090 [Termitomyces sp. Mi166|nr:hypothetical protein C0995_014090 [Termitomyces sp. Mi166\
MKGPEIAAHPATMIDTRLATGMAPSSATNPVVMQPPPPSLPSTIDETLSRCPRFRILVVGNDIDIADGRTGRADIDREYTSNDNPCFALHDSKGFEPGFAHHWAIVEEFIRRRSKKNLPIEQRLHALWLCIETPRTGSRLMQTADEDLLKLAIARNIPVIVVFTKFDLLFFEFRAKAARFHGEQDNRSIDQIQVAKDARRSLNASIDLFRQQYDPKKNKLFPLPHAKPSLNYVGVSTNQQFPGFLQTLEELTGVTRKCLHTQETFTPWAVAQRIDPKQKVQTSIEPHNSAEYWKNLARSTVFKDHVLKDCLWRIHLDIVKVWNFRDPQMFHVRMLKLIDPFIPQSDPGLKALRHLPLVAALAAIFGPIFPPLAIAFGAAGFTAVSIEFLYKNYRAAPETALYLEAYIIHLTLFLYELFVTALRTEWQKPLTSELIITTLEQFRETKSEQIHQLIRNNAPFTLGPEKMRRNIGDLIRRQLGMDSQTT